jgi:hypothetical protein
MNYRIVQNDNQTTYNECAKAFFLWNTPRTFVALFGAIIERIMKATIKATFKRRFN